MPHEVQGVVAMAKGRQVSHACGVCHTDLHYRDGGINDDFPFLLGHEAAGVVESAFEKMHKGEVLRSVVVL